MAGISPWVRGQTSPTWKLALQRDTTVFDLTNQQASYISLLIYNQMQSAVVVTGTGTVTIVQNDPAIITYKPAAADTATLTPGIYWIRFEVLYNGTDPDYCDFYPINIQA